MSHSIDGKEYLTITEAAENLGTTATRILMLLKKSTLKGREIDGEWLLEPDSVACCDAHGSDMKETKGCVSYCSSDGCGCK